MRLTLGELEALTGSWLTGFLTLFHAAIASQEAFGFERGAECWVHFEQCTEIPNEVREIYKSLKTTRPRGVGSPQTYWVQSAKVLGLEDSKEGIRFEEESANANEATTSENKEQSDMSV